MNGSIRVSAKTVDDAITEAMIQLGVTADQENGRKRTTMIQWFQRKKLKRRLSKYTENQNNDRETEWEKLEADW